MNPTLRERIDISIVGKLIKTKVNFGLSHIIKTKEVPKFTDDVTEELHKPVSKQFERRRVKVNVIDEIWAADLFNMQAFQKIRRK